MQEFSLLVSQTPSRQEERTREERGFTRGEALAKSIYFINHVRIDEKQKRSKAFMKHSILT
jgi:hypothetical protein